MDRGSQQRAYQKRRYAQHMADREKAIALLGGVCYLCGQESKRYDLHHHVYHPTESDYPRTGNGWSRIRRVREALDHPERFRLLCPRCHDVVTNVRAAPEVDLGRLFELLAGGE